jgi:hypothetical protein
MNNYGSVEIAKMVENEFKNGEYAEIMQKNACDKAKDTMIKDGISALETDKKASVFGVMGAIEIAMPLTVAVGGMPFGGIMFGFLGLGAAYTASAIVQQAKGSGKRKLMNTFNNENSFEKNLESLKKPKLKERAQEIYLDKKKEVIDEVAKGVLKIYNALALAKKNNIDIGNDANRNYIMNDMAGRYVKPEAKLLVLGIANMAVTKSGILPTSASGEIDAGRAGLQQIRDNPKESLGKDISNHVELV